MIRKFLVVFTFLFWCISAEAGVVLGGTRVIYEEGKKEASISIENKGDVPYLIQSWIENDRAGKSNAFLITPPLFRLDGDKKNALRIFKLEDVLPGDRESLFFLNVKSIPGGTLDSNTLQIAIRNRLKLIYRPTLLQKNSPESQTQQLKWVLSGSQLQVKNPTPYYQNFMFVNLDGKDVDLKEKNFVAPFSNAHFDVPAASGKKVSWKIISDYGSIGPLHTVNF
ncbi:molecular chaperone [Cedecea colo]|uniref:Molecular chaperone n=1 Tax=Cedecea colo TaxID=2552946 RepID=A0ABX0VLD6_9ENTR|nr:molecular chaperone [Cedecea colo]NIY47841.1 molecular chaperone [Cedecea colo]